MLENYTEAEIFQTAIRKLTFTNCFSLNAIFDYSCDDCYEQCFDDKIDNNLPTTEYDRLHKRYKRILSTIAKKAPGRKSTAALIKVPKIYDELLCDGQREVFNAVMKSTEYSQLGSSAHIDEGYCGVDKRKGVNFIELIFLLNINVSIHYRSLLLLNKPLKTSLDKKRAKQMLNKVLSNINSEKMVKLYIDAFFYILDNTVNEIYNDKAEIFIRTAWLPEELRGRKDAFRAMNTHKKNETKITLKKYKESQFDCIFSSGNPLLAEDLNKSMADYLTVDYIGWDVLPITFALLLKNKIDDEEELSKTREYILAKEYADIIEIYINQAIQTTVKIFKKLYAEENDNYIEKKDE